MTDYTRSTGNSATMMIRDKWSPGSGDYNVEFWLNSNNSVTYDHELPWSYSVVGGSSSGNANYNAGAGWLRVAVANHWGSGNVTFHIGATGTSGFGGPTDFTVWLNRATVPPATSSVTLSSITSTSMVTQFSGNGDGGSAITEWQLTYGTDPNTGQTLVASSGTLTVTGLTPGTVYYFWARGVNAMGAGPWSARSTATTLRVPDATSSPVISDITQITCVATFTANGDGGAAITAYQVGYGTSSSAPLTTVDGDSPKAITGLLPATTYYFWARALNSVGWGPWSESSTARTIAGARIKDGTVWREAVPYVRAGGVWKLARTWGKVGGIWKETS